MIRAIILFESEPDPDSLSAAHRRVRIQPVECSAFRHGKIFGSPFGEPSFRYYAEFEWDDMESFKSAMSSAGVRRIGQGRDGHGHPVHRPLRVDRE